MKFVGAAALGYFSLSGVSAIDGMAAAAGGPIPVDICGHLEDSLVIGDFPAGASPSRYFVTYNRQNRDKYRAFVKCAPYAHVGVLNENKGKIMQRASYSIEDVKARKRYAAMYVRKQRFGLYTCNRLTGGDDGWVMKADWEIKDCPAVEGGAWESFFPSDAPDPIPQEMTEKENPWMGPDNGANCPSINHYWYDGAWVESPCDDENYAHLTDGSCKLMSHEDFVETEIYVNGDKSVKQLYWSDENVSVRGIACGYNFNEAELTLGGKMRSITFENDANEIEWLHQTLIEDLQFLRGFHMEGQSQFLYFPPNMFMSLGRPKKMQAISFVGLTAVDIDYQWQSNFFGDRSLDGLGQFITLNFNGNSQMSEFKDNWLDCFVSMQNFYLNNHALLEAIPARLITKWSEDLAVFDVSNNAITTWPVEAEGVDENDVPFYAKFKEVPLLETIDLSNNAFTAIPGIVFSNLDPMYSYEIKINDNSCDANEDTCTNANNCFCDPQ
jgi:hypothetical protein